MRVDAGVEAGDEVPVAYDPMIAKLVAHGETREEALTELAARARRDTRVSGVTTNLASCAGSSTIRTCAPGDATTAFLTEHPPLSPPSRLPALGRAPGG